MCNRTDTIEDKTRFIRDQKIIQRIFVKGDHLGFGCKRIQDKRTVWMNRVQSQEGIRSIQSAAEHIILNQGFKMQVRWALSRIGGNQPTGVMPLKRSEEIEIEFRAAGSDVLHRVDDVTVFITPRG